MSYFSRSGISFLYVYSDRFGDDLLFYVINQHHFDGTFKNLEQAAFQSVSISTTAGYTTSSFDQWPLFLPILLLFASFIGGCAGSTGGGLKVIRILVFRYKET